MQRKTLIRVRANNSVRCTKVPRWCATRHDGFAPASPCLRADLGVSIRATFERVIMNRTLRLLAATGAVALIGFGAVGCAANDGPAVSTNATFDDVDLKSLTIKSASADVIVQEGKDQSIRVDGSSIGGPRGSVVEPTLEGGTLTLPFDCTGVTLGCEAGYVVQVPAGLAVTVQSTDGDVKAYGLAGPLTIAAHKGDVTLDQLSSESVTITGRDGDIDGTNLSTAKLHADVRNGDVELAFAAAPLLVDVVGKDGDVEIELPRELFAIKAESRKGDIEITAGRDDASANSISVVTNGGDIEIR